MQAFIKNNKIVFEFNFNEIDEDLISLFSAIEISKLSKASDEEIENLANEITENWWKDNKEFLLKNEISY